MENHKNIDLKILGRMANAAYICLEDKSIESTEERANNAALAIQEIYEIEKENLIEVSKKSLYIDLGESKKKSR